jgi:stage II sporulation protein E
MSGVVGLKRREKPAVPGLKRSRRTLFKAFIVRHLGWAWKPQLYAGLVVGFLLARTPGSELAPFGVAFYAAVRGAGFGGPGVLAVAAAVMAGSWTGDLQSFLWVALAIGVSHAMAPVFKLGRSGPSPLGAAVLATLAAAGPAAAVLGRENVVLAVFWTGLTGILALVFTLGVADAVNGKLLRGGPTESPVPVIVLLAAALCGLQGLDPAVGVSLREVAAGVMIMICAYLGGAQLGAAAGALLGIAYLFTTFAGDFSHVSTQIAAVAPLSMAYVVAGMSAGVFRDLRKIGIGIAFCLGLVTYTMATMQNTADLFQIPLSAAAATLLFWSIPRGWLASLPAVLTPLPASPPLVPAVAADGPTSAFIQRVAGISRVFKEVSRTFEQAATVEAPRDQSVGRVFEQVADRLCSSCSMYRICWHRQFDATYQVFTDLWEQIDREGHLTVQSTPPALNDICIHSAEVAFALNYLYDLQHSHNQWERRLEEGRTVVADYLKNMARMLDRFIDEVGTSGGTPRVDAVPVLKVVTGIARLPKKGSHITGDSFAAESLGSDRYMVALSDGMGVGREAATESRQCVALLRDILKAGFTTEVAVKTVNSVLLLHSPVESFATVDLALLDLATGRGEFVKVGAAPSFIKRGSEVTQVKVASVPVGIINQVQVEPEFRVMRPGDILIMITDGLWDAAKDQVDKERWLLDHLRRENSTDPEEIAESLLARALDLMPDGTTDDLTVLVVRIDAVTGAPPEAIRKSTSNWVPVRRAPKLPASGTASKSKR